MTSSGGAGVWRLVARFAARTIAIGALAAGLFAVTIPVPQVAINVRWKVGVTDEQRLELERRFQLTSGRVTEGPTRAYMLADTSTDHIPALVQHASVDDTANLNRIRFRPPFASDPGRIIPVYALIAGLAGAVLWVAVPPAAAVLRMPVRVRPSLALGAATGFPVLLAAAVLLIVVAAALGMRPLWR
jgi:hypothetical protein